MQFELDKIKNKYGEEMMHLCKNKFSTILETPELLYTVLSSRFDYNKELYNDIVKYNIVDDFCNYIYNEVNLTNQIVHTDKTPKELLKEAGYNLYMCTNEKELYYFKKYFRKDELLCSFYRNRLSDSYVFFAIKENANKLNRNDFISPQRQDEYGTSVISIQFTKGETNILKITNRYNHSVENSDATFSNNLDNIIPGLTDAFEKTYNLNIDKFKESNFKIPGYVQTSTLKYYKYNFRVSNTYFCHNNKIIHDHNEINTYSEKEKYLFMDCYVIDLQNRKVLGITNEIQKDSFLYGIINPEKIEIVKVKDHKIIKFMKKGAKDIIVEIDKNNNIVSYINNNSAFIGSNFMKYNTALKYLELQNVESIGRNALSNNENMVYLNLPKVKSIDSCFMYKNNSIINLSLPELKELGDLSFYLNTSIQDTYLPNLEDVGDFVFDSNENLKNKRLSIR